MTILERIKEADVDGAARVLAISLGKGLCEFCNAWTPGGECPTFSDKGCEQHLTEVFTRYLEADYYNDEAHSIQHAAMKVLQQQAQRGNWI